MPNVETTLQAVLANHHGSQPGRAAAAAFVWGLSHGQTVAQVRAQLRHCGRDDLETFASNPARLAPVIARARAYANRDVPSVRRAAARRLVGWVCTPQAPGDTSRGRVSPSKALKARFLTAYVGGRILQPGHEWDSVIVTAREVGMAMGAGAEGRLTGGRQLEAAAEFGSLILRQKRKGGGTVVALGRLPNAAGTVAVDHWESVEALSLSDPREHPIEITHPDLLTVLLRSPSRDSIWAWAPEGYWGHVATAPVSGIEAWGVMVALASGQQPRDLDVPRRKVKAVQTRLAELGFSTLLEPIEMLALIEQLGADSGADEARSAAEEHSEQMADERRASLAQHRRVVALQRDAEAARRKTLAARKKAARKATQSTDTTFVLNTPAGFSATNPAHVNAAVAAAVTARGGEWVLAHADAALVRLVRTDDLAPRREQVRVPAGYRKTRHDTPLCQQLTARRGGTWRILRVTEDGVATAEQISTDVVA